MVINFFDSEYRSWVQQEFDTIRLRRKNLKGKPDQYEAVELALDKVFEPFYKRVLSGGDITNAHNCRT